MRLLALLAALVPAVAIAAPPATAPSADQAVALAQKLIAYRTVAGPGNATPAAASYLRDYLIQHGFAPADVTVTPLGDTAYLVATLPGRDRAAKPLVISGHIDVVEAKPADWTRDPFTPVVENGYLFGRGATDMKLDLALAVQALIDMKREGRTPRRDIVLAVSGDEETAMRTSQALADRFRQAELVLNIDGGGGRYSADGKPLYFTFQGAEKTYADFRLSVTNPGGHSSMPRLDNAIVQLAGALTRIGGYRFQPQLNDITRGYFQAAAPFQSPAIGAAMRAFVANPADPRAVATLTADPATVGQIGTTCVATMVAGGHALNALPQRATANINCRIFPGTLPAQVMATLKQVAAEPALTITDVSEGTTPSPASPLRPDFVGAVTDAVHAAYAGLPVFPSMSAGASDSMWFRARGVPSYAASPIFTREDEDFSHGLNERTPLSSIAPGLAYYRVLLARLAG